jgi:hypothetical protein
LLFFQVYGLLWWQELKQGHAPLNILPFPPFVCTGRGTQSLGVWLV